ncbi:hypothetical protein AB1046_18350 [Promicromonospora sp. Populi]|uniref:hypothetical protein n=1 Tax=Promicromonospora sp. Populi TaxID=3239420 RepID=UPI0034E1DC27
MSNHDEFDFDADLGPGRDVLKQTIGALVDGATPVGLPSAPEQNLGFLRRRVRTWRIAKAGAVGLSTAVVISALAFSAAQANTWNQSEPLPGRPTIESTESGPVPSEIPTTRMSPSPSVTASPSPSASPTDIPETTPSGTPSGQPDPEPGGTATGSPDVAWPPFEPFEEGYLSWFFDVPPIACGVPIGDLPTDPVRFTLEPNDSPADLTVTSGFTITEVAGESYQLRTGGIPEYLLFQNGRLVSTSWGQTDVGWWGLGEGGDIVEEEDEDGNTDQYEQTSPNQIWQLDVSDRIDDISTCGERTDVGQPHPEFSTPLPAGEYEVVFAAPYTLVGDDTAELAYSDPYTVTIP